MAKKIDDAVLDELLKGCERPEDLMTDGGLMMEPRRALMRRMLGAELSEHLGYERGETAPPVRTNRRNGVSRKTLRSEDGTFAFTLTGVMVSAPSVLRTLSTYSPAGTVTCQLSP